MSKESFQAMAKWATKKEFSEFFRRFPPLDKWGTWKEFEPVSSGFHAVYDEDDLVGVATFNNYDPWAKSHELGLLVDAEDRDRIVATVMNILCTWAFQHLGNEKVVTRILSHRKRLAEKLVAHGFTLEGKFRKSCNGQDELIFGCLAGEFKEL